MAAVEFEPVRLPGPREETRRRRGRRQIELSMQDPRSASRHDRDRLVYSRSLLRLAGVTQVLTPSDQGTYTHNRLTHTFKVAQIARSIAELLLKDASRHESISILGGLDADVVEAAALAHDLGHPPFGHIGEEVLDQYARGPLDLEERFEGNAQSFRILARLEPREAQPIGVDAAAATLAATAKYPWHRGEARPTPPGVKAPPKFGYFRSEKDHYDRARAWLPDGYDPQAQSLEAAIMDIADDITYALHDLDDFRSAGIISVTDVRVELENWKDLFGASVRAGSAVQDAANRFGALREKLAGQPQYDAERFAEAVDAALRHFIGLTPTSNAHWRLNAQNARRFTSRLITEFSAGVIINTSPTREAAPLQLADDHWHLMQILKQITRDFVIGRPDVAALQRGQQWRLKDLLERLHLWVKDERDFTRAPSELKALWQDAGPRGLIDYVSGLSDRKAVALHASLLGEGTQTVLNGLAL